MLFSNEPQRKQMQGIRTSNMKAAPMPAPKQVTRPKKVPARMEDKT